MTRVQSRHPGFMSQSQNCFPPLEPTVFMCSSESATQAELKGPFKSRVKLRTLMGLLVQVWVSVGYGPE